MSTSQIVTENQLDEWVRRNAALAQGKIVELLSRLVCISCPRPSHRRFPLGDSIGQHGADGDLETAIGFEPFIPEGRSIWEIGTSIDARTKANNDYNSSTQATPEAIRRESTFVFVTPLSGRRDWKDTWKPDGIETWLEEKKALGEWKDVMVLDGTQLTDWVSQFPAVGHWLGTIFGQLPDDFDTAEYHWQIVSGFGAPPPLIPNLFTSEREQAGEKLRRLIVDHNDTQLRLDTRFPQHLKDFVCAYVASLPEAERMEHQNRVLIFDSAETFKKACSLNESHVFIIDFDINTDSGSQLIQRALQRRHAVIYSSPPGGPPHGNACELLSPRVHEMKEALVKCGYTEVRATSLTNRAGRDLNALLRLIQNLSALPDWATQSEASDLAIAQFIGQWRDELAGDQEFIGELSGNTYGEWIVKIRKIASSKAAPLEIFNGRWKFTSRYEPWLYLGKLIGSDVLDRFEKLAITVLAEADPRLELPKEQRLAANVLGRQRQYSKQLREGIAETIALLGSYGESLSACPDGRPQLVAFHVVNTLLTKADSQRWASLNDVLPLLAEAAPNAFLNAVGGASEKPDEPFSGVFAEEGGMFLGGSFVTGLLWALESLAWSSDYLIRVCSILANLATLDPGGQWSNRPANSLVTILLPWLPQTVADVGKRHVAVQAIVRDHPEVGWKLLLNLLPKHHSTSGHTYRPKWRSFIPEDWTDGVTYEQRWRDEAFYANLALELAGNDPVRLEQLLPFYFHLHPRFSNFAELLRERLQSEAFLSLPEGQRFELWMALTTKITNHRKYAGSHAWASSEEALQGLDAVINKLKPENPEMRHKRLFSGHDFDLYEGKGDWEEQHNNLLQRRIGTVREILDRGGFQNLIAFWRSVESPHEVGYAYGSDAEQANDAEVLPTMLESETEADFRFAISYIWSRFHLNHWDWVDNIDRANWSIVAKTEFYVALPFVNETWKRVTVELAENEPKYWERAQVRPDRDHLERIDIAIDRLIEYGRSDAAIQCFWLGNLWGGVFSELCLSALEAFTAQNRVDVHVIGEVFSHLQKDEGVDEERLAAMEVKFLDLLDSLHDAKPQTLYRHLAERPDFFCDVIRMIYRSTHEAPDEFKDKPEVDETVANIADRSYRLLMGWDYPPGLHVDGSFNGYQLHSWVAEVKNKCVATGHWEAASHQIGEVLLYAPKNENGLWMEPVCELLDSKEDVEYRRGLQIRIFNERGAYWFSGGKEEIELAEKWEGSADLAENKGYVRLGTTLREIGNRYREDAKRAIIKHRHEYD